MPGLSRNERPDILSPSRGDCWQVPEREVITLGHSVECGKTPSFAHVAAAECDWLLPWLHQVVWQLPIQTQIHLIQSLPIY